MSDTTNIDIKEKGEIGEAKFNHWLKSENRPYISICQSPDTFPNLFKGNVKRPDFMLLIAGIGLIAIDVKNCGRKNNQYTLELEKEWKRAINFERLFRMPLWYAYLSEDEGSVWYWISALNAIEVGKTKMNEELQIEFIAMDLSKFERIETADDLSKLFTHHLPGTDKIAEHAIDDDTVTT